jgi:hypothetical protein
MKSKVTGMEIEKRIPDGYRRVHRGRVRDGDRCWDHMYRVWFLPHFNHIGDPVSEFHAVIRKVNK